MRFLVNSQQIKPIDKRLTVSGTLNYYIDEFQFDSTWDGFAKTAVYVNCDTSAMVVIDGNAARVPYAILEKNGYFKVGVFGVKTVGETTIRIPTIYTDLIYIAEGCMDGVIIPDPDPGVYEQMITLAQEAKDAAEEAVEIATLVEGMSAEAETLAPGESATVDISTIDDHYNLQFKIPRGDVGATGPQGEQGIQGPKGETGSRGPQGEQGIQGPKGETGIQGPKGTKGDTGAQGPIGPTGPQGIQGVQGPRGIQGNTGSFGTPTATVDANVGTPSVTITASGPDSAKIFAFEFHNLKGEPGEGTGDMESSVYDPDGDVAEVGIPTYVATHIPIEDSVTSSSADKALSAKQGKLLNDRVNNLSSIGRFLALWDCTTGLPLSNPSGYPYEYHTGDYFRISAVAGTSGTNYIPEGDFYQGIASTTPYTGEVAVGDIWFYTKTGVSGVWQLQINHEGGTVQDVYVNGSSVMDGKIAKVTVPTNNNQLTNGAGYQTSAQVDSKITAHNVDSSAHSDIRQAITSAVSTHNSSSSAHSDIRSLIPTKVSDITNDSGYQDADEVEAIVSSKGYITGITSSDVTTALGFTPYSAANPNNYISEIDSSDVTTALGYTPYNDTNPSGYQTSSQVDTSISTHNASSSAHSDLFNALDEAKVDKVSGKGLSTEDFTTAEKTKLAGLSADFMKFIGEDNQWSSATLPSSANWQSVTYGNGKFVAVALSSNAAAYSSDGINWTAATLPSSASWYSVTYGNGKFVAVAYNSNKAAYSTDGINWTSATLPSSAYWQSLTYGGGKFVAATYSSNKTAYSSDGINWTAATLPSSENWQSVTYGNGKFVAVVPGSNKAAYSTDGINWTAATLPSSANWYSVTYGDGKFVVVTAGSSNKTAYSTDGINWTAATLPSSANWWSVTYGNGKFVAVASNSNNSAYSTDGVNWTADTLPSSAKWYSVTYGDGKFVAVAYSSNTATYTNTMSHILQNGIRITDDVKDLVKELPSSTAADSGKFLSVNASGAPEWQKVPMPSVGSITLSTTWSGSASPYSQVVSGLTVTANSKVDLQPDSVAIQQMVDDGCVALYIANNNGTLTCYAVGEHPTASLTIQVTITEVA